MASKHNKLMVWALWHHTTCEVKITIMNVHLVFIWQCTCPSSMRMNTWCFIWMCLLHVNVLVPCEYVSTCSIWVCTCSMWVCTCSIWVALSPYECAPAACECVPAPYVYALSPYGGMPVTCEYASYAPCEYALAPYECSSAPYECMLRTY